MEPVPNASSAEPPGGGGYDMELDPLLKERLKMRRGVFVTGKRLRMNVVPMFANVFLPWGVFLFCCSIVNFRLHYLYAWFAWLVIFLTVVAWLILVGVAVWARRSEPDPTWFTYAAIAVGIAIFAGVAWGDWNYETYYRKFFEVEDLKVVGHLDAGKERGSNHMDGGIFNFADGNHIEATKSWHFKHGTVYCVAPIVGKSGAPETGSYDFWAVGTDCCSTSSSDFRCGSFDDPMARSALRVLDDSERPFYRLAVEQAETLYGVMSTYPIFVRWERDPLDKAIRWREKGFECFLCGAAMYMAFSVILVAVCSFKFAWIGRKMGADLEDLYDESFHEKPSEGFEPGGPGGPPGVYGGPPGTYGPPGSFVGPPGSFGGPRL